MLKAVGLLIASLLFVLCAWNAEADESEDYTQITCKPESNYFALRTLTLWIPDCKIGDRCEVKDSSNSDSRLYYANSLLAKPYECKLQDKTISVSTADFQAACTVATTYNIQVRVNGKLVREFPAYGSARCGNSQTHLVEISPAGFSDCALPDQAWRSKKSMECFHLSNIALLKFSKHHAATKK